MEFVTSTVNRARERSTTATRTCNQQKRGRENVNFLGDVLSLVARGEGAATLKQGRETLSRGSIDASASFAAENGHAEALEGVASPKRSGVDRGERFRGGGRKVIPRRENFVRLETLEFVESRCLCKFSEISRFPFEIKCNFARAIFL